MTFNGLVVAAAMLLLWLVLCDISEIQAIDERKTEERREAFRQEAYARTRRAATIKRNREQLWRETICK
jgi:predicted Holliday junction resolvase-like endonuclease